MIFNFLSVWIELWADPCMSSKLYFRYRNINPRNSTEKPTPTEFVQFILDSAKVVGAQNVDNHIKVA